MISFNGYDLVSIITVFLFTLLITVLLNTQNRAFVKNKIFAAYLTTNIMLILFSFAFREKIFSYVEHPYLLFINLSIYLTLAPLLYLYFCHTRSKGFGWQQNHLRHFIIVPLLFIGLIIIYRLRLDAAVTAIISPISGRGLRIYLCILHGQIIFYLALIFKIFSTLESEAQAGVPRKKWLKQVLFVFLTHWCFDLINAVLTIVKIAPPQGFRILSMFAVLTLMVFAMMIVTEGVQKLPFFGEKEAIPKYANSNLVHTERTLYQQKLTRVMEEEKPYLNPDLCLGILAKKLDIHPKYLSQVINESFEQNFFDFVNGYRIREAQNMLTDPGNSDLTVLEILYEVGFNSKSAFNRAFKKHAGMTPTAYKTMRQTPTNGGGCMKPLPSANKSTISA